MNPFGKIKIAIGDFIYFICSTLFGLFVGVGTFVVLPFYVPFTMMKLRFDERSDHNRKS